MMKNNSPNKTKKIHFSSDGFKLNGVLHLPDAYTEKVVVGSHGLASSGDSPKQIALAEKCCERGIAFFRFDHRGCGQSDGDFILDTTFEGRCNDLKSAIQAVTGCGDVGSTIGLFGSSLGGAAAISVAGEFSVEAIAVLAAPLDIGQINSAPEEVQALLNIQPEDFKDHLPFDISDKLSHLKNIIIFHGDNDDVVPFKNAEEIYSRTGEPKKLIIQKGGDHRMSDPIHQKAFLEQVLDWYSSYL